MSNAEVIWRSRGVTKAFDGLKVLSDVSFDVRRGRRMALIGQTAPARQRSST